MKQVFFAFGLMVLTACVHNTPSETGNDIIGAFGINLGSPFDNSLSLRKNGNSHLVSPPARVDKYSNYMVTEKQGKIHGISGMREYREMATCLKKREEISKSISREYAVHPAYSKGSPVSAEIFSKGGRAILILCDKPKKNARLIISYVNESITDM